MKASRGMGIINPDKMPKAKVKKRRDNTDFTEDGQVRERRDDTDFTEYAEGGKVNAAEYAATTKAKRAGKAAGKQFVAQPKTIAKKTAGYR